MVNPVTNQQSMPKIDSPMVGEDGALKAGSPWYKFLQYLWQLLGSGTANPAVAVNLASGGSVPGTLDVFDSSGNRIGSVTLGP